MNAAKGPIRQFGYIRVLLRLLCWQPFGVLALGSLRPPLDLRLTIAPPRMPNLQNFWPWMKETAESDKHTNYLYLLFEIREKSLSVNCHMSQRHSCSTNKRAQVTRRMANMICPAQLTVRPTAFYVSLSLNGFAKIFGETWAYKPLTRNR